jgi:putative endonuclease
MDWQSLTQHWAARLASWAPSTTTKAKGDAAEARALAHARGLGLKLVTRQFKTPGRGGGEIDLILRARDGTLVFVEVRARRSDAAGGAAASVGKTKQARLIYAARHFLQQRGGALPPCRFDVCAIDGDAPVQWIEAAFELPAD